MATRTFGSLTIGGDINGDAFFNFVKPELMDDPPQGVHTIRPNNSLLLRFNQMREQDLDWIKEKCKKYGISYSLYYERKQESTGEYYNAEKDRTFKSEVTNDNKNTIERKKIKETLEKINVEEIDNNDELLKAVEGEIGEPMVATYEPAKLTVQGYDYHDVLEDESLKASVRV